MRSPSGIILRRCAASRHGLTDLYRECGLYLLSLAMRSGLPEREAREVQAVLRGSG